VTRASAGIGLAAARELARPGARVVLAVRDPVACRFRDEQDEEALWSLCRGQVSNLESGRPGPGRGPSG
jgi:NAD(P)-dependent dehydrogenase (short-subunit alcohol dehydrogenase family)